MMLQDLINKYDKVFLVLFGEYMKIETVNNGLLCTLVSGFIKDFKLDRKFKKGENEERRNLLVEIKFLISKLIISNEI